MQDPGTAWSERDWALAQALVVYDQGLCPGCGQPRHLSMDPALEDAWTVPPPSRCYACTTVAYAAEPYFEDQGGGMRTSHPQALAFHATLPDDVRGDDPDG